MVPRRTSGAAIARLQASGVRVSIHVRMRSRFSLSRLSLELRNSPLSAVPRPNFFERRKSSSQSRRSIANCQRSQVQDFTGTLVLRWTGPKRTSPRGTLYSRAWSRAWSAATKGATPCHLGRVSRSLFLNLVVRCCSALWHGTTIRHSHGH